jgi:hypothetical protein
MVVVQSLALLQQLGVRVLVKAELVDQTQIIVVAQVRLSLMVVVAQVLGGMVAAETVALVSLLLLQVLPLVVVVVVVRRRMALLPMVVQYRIL